MFRSLAVALALVLAAVAPSPAAVPVYVFEDYAWAGSPAPAPASAFAFYGLVGRQGSDAALTEADVTGYGALDPEGYPLTLQHKELRLELLGTDQLAAVRIFLYGKVKDGHAVCHGFAVSPAKEGEWLFGTLQVCREIFNAQAAGASDLAWELLVRIGAEAGDRPVADEAEAQALTQALRDFTLKSIVPLRLQDVFLPHRDLVTEVRAGLFVLVDDQTWPDHASMLNRQVDDDGKTSVLELLAESVREQYQAVARLVAEDPGLAHSVLAPGTHFLPAPEGGFRGKPEEDFFRRSEERRARELILEGFRAWWDKQGLQKGGLEAKAAALSLGAAAPTSAPEVLFGTVDDPPRPAPTPTPTPGAPQR